MLEELLKFLWDKNNQGITFGPNRAANVLDLYPSVKMRVYRDGD